MTHTMTHTIPPPFQNGAKSGFEMCFPPSTLGAGCKTRLGSSLKKLPPRCIHLKVPHVVREPPQPHRLVRVQRGHSTKASSPNPNTPPSPSPLALPPALPLAR